MTGGAANLKNLDEMLRKRSKIEKIRMAKLPRNIVHAPSNVLKKDGPQNTLFGLLFEGNQNCCLTETAAPQSPVTPKPEPEVHKTVDMFEDDQELKEQARIARLKKEEEEREAKIAAKEAEKLRKQKEKEEKERRKEKPVRAGFSARSTC